MSAFAAVFRYLVGGDSDHESDTTSLRCHQNTPMTDHNNQVRDFLAYYLDLKTAPKYAVMLKGPWGSGKSHFAKAFLTQHLQDSKFFYVSLYGLSSTAQIDDELFRQMHPFLSSKTVKFAGRVLKAGLKMGFKLDLDKAGHASLDTGVPEIDLKEFVKGGVGAVIAFDDIERCKIPLPELLGYINAFVEHDDVKAVLIANEEEIERDLSHAEAGARGRYDRTKEKLIGQTITISPNVDEALATFVEETSTATQAILNRYRDRIKEVYEQSELQNLRSLRLALLDFERMLGGLSDQAAASKALLEALLERFLIFTIEIKAGNLQAASIPEQRHGISSHLGAQGSQQDEALERLRRKYRAFASWDPVLTGGLWTEIFNEGLFDFARINESLATSSFLLKQEQPDWVRLWHAHELGDEEFEALSKRSFENLRGKAVSSIGVIRHLVAMLLHYQSLQLVPHSRAEILEVGKACIDDLRASGRLLPQAASEFTNLRMNGWKGLGFHGPQSPEFQELNAYIRSTISQAEQDERPNEAQKLLELMRKDVYAFANQVLITNSGEARFYKIPIFTYIKPEDLVAAIVELSGESAIMVSQVFGDRYKGGNFYSTLFPEHPWIQSVIETLQAKQAELAGRARSIRLGMILEGFQDANACLIERANPDQAEE